MKVFKYSFVLFILFCLFVDDVSCFGFSRPGRKRRNEHCLQYEPPPVFIIDDGARKELNFGNNEVIFGYQEYKNKLLNFVSSSRLGRTQKEKISSDLCRMKNVIEEIIKTSRGIEEKNLNITEESQLVLFNKTIDILNSFFTDSLRGIVEKYEKICKKVEKSREFFWIEAINEEYTEYPFLRSVEFSEKFNQLQKMHKKMDKYILLFFEWLNLYLKQDE